MTKRAVRKKMDFETIKIEKIKAVCQTCENYAREQSIKPVAIISCEGACLRGEIARRAANILCHSLAPGKTVRICLGGAFTKDTGQRNLVRNAKKVIAVEGCFIRCASRMMNGVIPDLKAKVIVADSLYNFDRSLFGVNEMPENQIKARARKAADKIMSNLK